MDEKELNTLPEAFDTDNENAKEEDSAENIGAENDTGNPLAGDDTDGAAEIAHEPSDMGELSKEGSHNLRDTDYSTLAESDLRELKTQFPELSDTRHIAELDNPLRYAALRDLGLSPKEAYLATREHRWGYDNRSHLATASPPAVSRGDGYMSAEELDMARDLFSELSDRELQRLYKRVAISRK